MTLWDDDIINIKKIAWEIAKEAVDSVVKKLEADRKEAIGKIERKIENSVTRDEVRSMQTELKKELEKPVTKGFSKK